MHIDSDTLPLHRAAVLASVDVVNAVTPTDLGRPTPCDGWTLADLLAHMTVQHHGFAAAAGGHGDNLDIWDPATVRDAVCSRPAQTYAASADEVLRAFAADGVLEASFALPEMGPGAAFPGSMAIGFHFIDYVVHGWDVARTIGAEFALPDNVVSAALPLALAVPDGEFRAMDNAPFGPAVGAAGDGSELDRLVAHLGRSPSWTAHTVIR